MTEKEKPIKLRPSHYRQLLSILHDAESEGWSYGRKEDFDRRMNDLISWANVMYEESNG